ncbi:hypothetical protein, partial [Kosmotoga pacifica]|uniref:hypothetical protein n=1 Tax=Kosmotoga pacifica TaxID=1330330 RepID=UPI00258ABF81
RNAYPLRRSANPWCSWAYPRASVLTGSRISGLEYLYTPDPKPVLSKKRLLSNDGRRSTVNNPRQTGLMLER